MKPERFMKAINSTLLLLLLLGSLTACQYPQTPEREMRESHSAMDVTETQFNALTENLILAMEQNGVTTGAQNRLLALLAPLHEDIRGL